MHQHAARKAGHNAAKFLLWNEMRERRSKKVQGFIRRRRAVLALGARRARLYVPSPTAWLLLLLVPPTTTAATHSS